MLLKARGILCFYFLTCLSVSGQIPLGSWREHLPYGNGVQVAGGKSKIYCSTPYSLIVFDPSDNSVEKLSKVSGLSEIGISAIASDENTGKLAIAYGNSNIDILEESRIYNINDLKIKNLNADKSIGNIYWNQQQVYLCSGIGIIVIDAIKHQVKDTYVIGDAGNYLRVNGVAADAQFIYAATSQGLKRAPVNSVNLADYRQWTTLSGLPSAFCKNVLALNNTIIVEIEDRLWIADSGGWKLFYSDGYQILRSRISSGKIMLSEKSAQGQREMIIKPDGSAERIISPNLSLAAPMDAIQFNSETYLADARRGLVQISGSNYSSYTPDGPSAISDGQMILANGDLWVAPGSITSQWEKGNRYNGLSRFSKNEWINYDTAFRLVSDIISIAAEQASGKIWAGSFGDGLAEFNPGNTLRLYKENSFIKPSETFPGFYGAAGLSLDRDNNLWISNYGAASSIIVRKPDGNTRSFVVPGASFEFAFSRIIIDDDNQKWIISPKNNGLFLFNSGTSVDNPADDRWKHYTTGAGKGNLPDNNVLCAALDKNGFIWVGTAKGIGIIQCSSNAFSSQGCDAVLPIVQQDNFAGYLFSNEQVQSIAVDGADRKWIATKNGVWLISKYGDKTIYHFTSAGSPLLDNDVSNVVIDPLTGEVFFETAKGICSFRADATGQETAAQKVLVFPNPVPPTFSGTIAIRGLPDNSIVKIVELDGRLVYQTRANGTTASWNGMNYKGGKVSPGVYLVLTKDDNGKDQVSTKIVIVK